MVSEPSLACPLLVRGTADGWTVVGVLVVDVYWSYGLHVEAERGSEAYNTGDRAKLSNVARLGATLCLLVDTETCR